MAQRGSWAHQCSSSMVYVPTRTWWNIECTNALQNMLAQKGSSYFCDYRLLYCCFPIGKQLYDPTKNCLRVDTWSWLSVWGDLLSGWPHCLALLSLWGSRELWGWGLCTRGQSSAHCPWGTCSPHPQRIRAPLWTHSSHRPRRQRPCVPPAHGRVLCQLPGNQPKSKFPAFTFFEICIYSFYVFER